LWPELEFDPGLKVERVMLRAGDELLLVLESDDPEVPEIEIGSDVSAVHLFQDNAVVLAGNPATRFEVLGRTFAVSAASFFQVNTSMAARMVQHVLGKLPSPAGTILDLYCGVRLFSAFLAPRCQRLVGVESSASACADFMVNLDEFNNVELYEGLAEEILPHLDLAPDAVVLDPPRAGLDRRVLDALIARKPASLIYISCDPSTLARDAGRLVKSGYRLVEAVPFDLFPQTYHIESISVFSRA
jgi:23S rRNA (uracil1939-C5)-methyltransferase